MIEWGEQLFVGILDIDYQHQVLVRRFNAFILSANTESSAGNLDDILRFMRNYATFHFDNEEEMMRKHEYPETALHVSEHKKFMSKHSLLYERFLSGDTTVVEDTTHFLEGWVAHHIGVFDKKLGAYIVNTSQA